MNITVAMATLKLEAVRCDGRMGLGSGCASVGMRCCCGVSDVSI